ncbi:MAG TPA: alpha/beta hydrolase-fold protein [Pyrinomonadaceae bacterium]|jgi:enterochelin esterase family protein
MRKFGLPLFLSLLFVVPAHGRAGARAAGSEEPESPRLSALRRALGEGRGGAVEEFWREAAREGSPLVESIKGDEENLLVTFLWRDGAAEKYVAVFPFARVNPLPHLFARVEGTDVWFRSYRLRRDARFEYMVAAHDSLTPFAAREPAGAGGWLASLRPDPLNPRRFVEPPDEESPGEGEYVSSYLELPGAPPQPFVRERAGVRRGRVELIRYGGGEAEGGRRVWVYTPPGYGPGGGPYRLLVLFDGWQYTHQIPTPTILDNMLADGVIPPTVAVMVDERDRVEQFYLNPSFADFVAGELVPWVRRRYRVTLRPRGAVLGGLSLGGVAAAYTALRHPEVFGGVLSQSGAFQYRPEDPGGLIRQLAQSARRPLRFYLEAGLLEVNESPSLLHSNRHLRDVLEAKGYEVTYSEFNGRHDHVCWRGSLSKGLAALLAPRPR